MSAYQPTRREILRVGGGSLLGLSLPQMLQLQALASGSERHAPGWRTARSVILIFLQGGPSHLDLWDPKDGVPDDVVSPFATIPSRVPGMEVTELLPHLATVTDKLTFIRSMSYSPNGLFNHTAAHYQMLTGYTTDRVSPSGQLEPPSPKDFPNIGCNITRLRPPDVPMLPFVMMPRPLQESNVIGKAGTAGFLGRAHDPYYLFPSGGDLDNEKMSRIKAGDLTLRPEISLARLERRANLREAINGNMPAIERAVAKYDLDEYTERALDLILSGRARDAFDIDAEAGTRFVQINWPKVANSDRHSWDVHKGLNKRMKDEAAPMLDSGLASLLTDLDARGLLDETLVVAVGEFGRSPRKGLSTSGNDNDADGRDHWPYCFTAVVAGGGVKRGHVHGRSDETASAPVEDPVHPTDLLATIYHAVGIDPETMMMNHLDQPRELVKGRPVLDLFA